MRESRIGRLLEELSVEIDAQEKKNRELYASAVDIEDESLSLKTQNESFLVLRRMKDLRKAMAVFRGELEKSGLLIPEAAVHIAPEPVRVPVPEPVRVPAPEPVHVPRPEPVHVPAPEPVHVPRPEPVHVPAPEPVHVPRPEPVHVPRPEPVHVPAPEPVHVPRPEPVHVPAPEPVRVPRPEPVNVPAPEPAQRTAPKFTRSPKPVPPYVTEAKPEPVYAPEPEQIYVPEPEPEPVYIPEPEYGGLIGELGRAVGEINAPVRGTAVSVENSSSVMPYAGTEYGYTVNFEKENEEDDDFGEFGESEIPAADEFREITGNSDAVTVSGDTDEDIVISGLEFKEFNEDGVFYSGSIGVDGKEGIPPIFEKTAYEEPADDVDESALIDALGDLGYIGDTAGQEQDDEEEDVAAAAENFGFQMPGAGVYGDKMPAAFTLFGRRIEVRDWQEMLVKICEVLILKSPYMVAQFDKYQNLNPIGQVCFSYDEGSIRHMGRRLSNGLWVEVNRTPDDTVNLGRKLLELCGYQKSELAIEIRE